MLLQAIEFWSTIAEEEFEILLVSEGEDENQEVGRNLFHFFKKIINFFFFSA